MRILIIHPHLEKFGGSERLTKILVYELASMGHEVYVFTKQRNEVWFPSRPSVYFKYIRKCEGCPKLSLGHVNKLEDVLFSLSQTLADVQPDVVLTMIQEPIYSILSKTVDPSIGTAIYIHYPLEEEVTEANLFTFLESYRFPNMYNNFYRAVDIHMVNSNYTAAALYTRFGIEANVVYPAIEWAFFKEEPDLAAERENLVITVGRFIPIKRQDVLIRKFFDVIKPEVPDAKLVIIGVPDDRYPDYRTRLKELASEGEDVEIVDEVLGVDRVLDYFKRAKVYLHMRRGEHFGMAPVEAMSQGVIPVLPADSGLAELISHGRDGFLAHNDEECILYALKILKMGAKESHDMRKLAYRKSWYFNPDRFARETLAYLLLVSKRRI